MPTRDVEPSGAEKVASILLAFVGSSGVHERLGVSEIARAVGRERSQVSRMLKALAQTRLLEQDPEDRTYHLGWPLQVLAAGAGNQALIRAARPILQALVARTGETALLSVQQASTSLTVFREDSRHALRAGGWVGRSSPLHCTGSGRALMFDTDPELVAFLVEEDLKLPAPGPRAPRTLDELLARLKTEHAQGYSFASEEVEVGLTSLGAPVRDGSGQIIAVVNTSGPSSRVVERKDEIGRLTVAAAAALAKELRRPPGRLPQ